MSNIDFVLSNLVIRNTRSAHQDTNYVAFAITKNDAMFSSQVLRLGDQNSGTHPVNVTVTIPSVYVSTDRLVLSYIVINHGGDAAQLVSMCAKNAVYGNGWNGFNSSDAQVVYTGNKFLPSCMAHAARGWHRDDWWKQAKPAFQTLITQRCDGPVVMDCFSFTGGSIPQILAAANQAQPFDFDYPGTDSPSGCGSNSDYSVRWYAASR